MLIPIADRALAADPCSPIVNPIACENSKQGTPSSIWDISGAGSATIQGFPTEISVNVGETVRFKVSTPATSYRIDIYRMGYYAGNGARKIGQITPVGRQTQPTCLSNASTGLVDCGNWAVSASWAVPAHAVSGIYFAHLIRTDSTVGESHVHFVVRNDASQSDLLFQTSDTTWQAYNQYGGNSLYVGSPAGRAYKVSYNRPITTRGTEPQDYVYNAEYPMVRFLESNGYDVSYTSGVDTDRRGGLLLNHKVFMSVGHDEYWSGQQRANVEAARDAGVHLAFFSGNEVYWKTRWESSTDGSGTPYRTLVTYKETHANGPIDPQDPPVWTGTWRDPRFSPPGDGGRPENALTGTIFKVQNTRDLQVPAADGKMRFWRGTSVATQNAGSVMTLGSGLVGYEWDEDPDNGFRPAGLIRMSTTQASGGAGEVLLDYGNTFGPGQATHHLTLYRAASGALVFGAGTVQWSWGLDSNHDRGSAAASVPVRQATVNLFADMDVQPGTLQGGLTAATPSADSVAPTVVITSPSAGSSIEVGTSVTISGTAADTGGVVGSVEVSTDGGLTWHPASGRGTWTHTWTPTTLGTVTLMARASDDSVNLGAPAAAQVTVRTRECPCSLWPNSTVPGVVDGTDVNAVEVGVKFRADTSGRVTGVRFYKAAANTGTHVGHLWTASGTLLGTVTFSGETGSGWQQALFATPINITAGTTYVVSYYAPNGHYSLTTNQFTSAGRDAPPLRALRSGVDGLNGVYRYGSGGGFPASSWNDANYWVDVVFTNTAAGDTTPPTVSARTPAPNSTGVAVTTAVTATFSETVQAGTVNMTVRDPADANVAGTVNYNSGTATATFTPASALVANTVYTVTVSGARDGAGNQMASTSWSFTTAPASNGTFTLWPNSTVPGVVDGTDVNAVEVGVKFRADTSGRVTGVRFYKAAANTGTHVGHLWTASGTLLGTVTFATETATGWQQALFSTPIDITAGTTYVVSYYAPVGHYSLGTGYFTSAGRDAPPLHALRSGVDGPNGVFRYGAGGGFPNSSWSDANYWVDVVFDNSTGGPDTTPPTVTGRTPAPGATGVAVSTTVTATFNEAVQANSVSVSVRNPSNTAVTGTTTYNASARTATFTPASALAANTAYTVTVSGATDAAGNPMAQVTWSFTTAPATTTTVSLWPNTTVPATVDSTDVNAVEVGVKFRADTSGRVTGVRFYKAATNTGTHVGHLWTASGTLLGTVTFSGETGSGWQQALFATPINITAGTTYVVSYYAPVGRYSLTTNGFTSAGRDAPPLRALRSGVDGLNGVYRYGSGGGFPASSWNDSNYWVDVVFATG